MYWHIEPGQPAGERRAAVFVIHSATILSRRIATYDNVGKYGAAVVVVV